MWPAPLRNSFIALRSYLPADHPDKNKEIGSEPDPATFLDTLLQLTAEWGRVLAPWGSIAIELGDTYSAITSGGERSDGGQYGYWPTGGTKYNVDVRPPKGQGNWPRPKCLALVPQLYAASLAYGRNLLTGQPSPAGQWLVRNMIVWHRPNPAVGALGDKYRPSTSYITVATRSPKRFFDLTAVRSNTDPRSRVAVPNGEPSTPMPCQPTAGAPPLDTWTDHHDTWTITTQPSSLAHYAMWPARLAERLVLSMCPAEVCATCGEPRRRVEGGVTYVNARNGTTVDKASWSTPDLLRQGAIGRDNGSLRSVGTESWTDCGHNNYQPGTVLDPFCGTFTTGCVAEFHGRSAIGIDIDERNRELWPLRREEVFRSLNPTHVKPIEGQLDMFGEVVA